MQQQQQEQVTSPPTFPAFADLVSARFQLLATHPEVFVVEPDDTDVLWQMYLKAFPVGTNPHFKQRTEHDCSCCQHFIKHIGYVVAVDEGLNVLTIWDNAAEQAPYPYNVVATKMRDAVRAGAINGLFRVAKDEGSFGAKETLSYDPEKMSKVFRWNHFYTGEIPSRLRSSTPDAMRGEYRTNVQVFERGLKELQAGAFETVLDLIDDNNLYRGAEFRGSVAAFSTALQQYNALSDPANPFLRTANLFFWTAVTRVPVSFRNSSIGSLVQDLSDGVDVEKAVAAYEAKVAPTNYKRPTKIITKAQVEKAMATIEELGLEPALERRFARLDDISVRDVLWVDSETRPLMKGGLGHVLMEHANANANKDNAKDEQRAEPISVDDFLARILPETASMEVLFKNPNNLVSLTAPVHPEVKQLFRWDNDFAWSYVGNVADSIKERVKKAGGNVSALLRVSLSWFNYDDLDIHVVEPNGNRIHYANRRSLYGELDVDMNAHQGTTREAVENVAWGRVADGVYRVMVHNFEQRERSDGGFVVEVESGGRIEQFSYSKIVGARAEVWVANLIVRQGVVERFEIIDPGITTKPLSQEKWGLRTEAYAKVNAVTLSPNYWGDNKVGNRHTFFVLDGCLNDEATRGIYNEFLHPRLEQHRKVFETIGEKTKCQPTEGQLSGLGFSSTKKDSVIVRVTKDRKQRLLNVQFGA